MRFVVGLILEGVNSVVLEGEPHTCVHILYSTTARTDGRTDGWTDISTTVCVWYMCSLSWSDILHIFSFSFTNVLMYALMH